VFDLVATELSGVARVADFQHSAADIIAVCRKEAVDPMSIDRAPATKPKVLANRIEGPEVSEVHRANWWPGEKPSQRIKLLYDRFR
jgi:hypothetical protein